MTPDEIHSQLERIADSDDFERDARTLVEVWRSEGAGIEAIEPILTFMREHPDIDFGMPGPLVHFLERFYREGYEEPPTNSLTYRQSYEQALTNSLNAKPTTQTVWMLNRLINGTAEPEARARLIRLMESIATSPRADRDTTRWAAEFLKR